MIAYNDITQAHVELSSYCNASCPNCPRNVYGGYPIPGLVQRTMTKDEFCTIFHASLLMQMNRFLFCGNYGDPIMCSDLPDIIEYIFSVNDEIIIEINTNGGARTQDWWKRLARLNKIGKIIVSFGIDGLKDTNHIYRKNVNFDKLRENFKAYISEGGIAIWDMLVFEYNESQIESVREYAAKEGFAEVRIKRPFGFNVCGMKNNEMPVLDNNGDIQYVIKESKLYSMDRAVTKESEYTFTKMTKNDMIAEIERQRKYVSPEEFGYLDSTEIVCMTSKNKEIYVSSDGNVYPCCFIGHASQELNNSDVVVLRRWMENNIDVTQINGLSFPIKQIVEGEFFKKLQMTWNSLHSSGRPPQCAMICANTEHNAINQLHI